MNRRSRDTDGSPASILETRDWLDPRCSARSDCVNPWRERVVRNRMPSLNFILSMTSAVLAVLNSCLFVLMEPLVRDGWGSMFGVSEYVNSDISKTRDSKGFPYVSSDIWEALVFLGKSICQ